MADEIARDVRTNDRGLLKDLNKDAFACVLQKPVKVEALIYAIEKCVGREPRLL